MHNVNTKHAMPLEEQTPQLYRRWQPAVHRANGNLLAPGGEVITRQLMPCFVAPQRTFLGRGLPVQARDHFNHG